MVKSQNAPPPLRGPGRPTKDQPVLSDDEILRVGFDFFARRGYDGTSLRALGERLGVSHNLIGARFGSKAEFWKRAVSERISLRAPPIESIFEEDYPTERMRLEALVGRYTELASKDKGLANLVWLENSQDSWRLDFLLDNYIRHFYHKLEDLLLKVGVESGTKPIPPSPFIIIMILGIGGYYSSFPLLRKLDSSVDFEERSTLDHAQLFAEILLPRVVGLQHS